MKIHNPIFLPFALLVLVSLAMANHSGWNLMQAVASQTWQRTSPSTQHK